MNPPRLRQALWNLRFPGLFIMGPVLSLVLIDLFYGLPHHLWFLAGGFFAFSTLLFVVLLRGEYQRLGRTNAGR